jgi:hypothetical protein
MTDLLTHPMELSPSWEAHWFSGSQIPRILLNLKVHYPVYKCLPPVPVLNQINPFYETVSNMNYCNGNSGIYLLLVSNKIIKSHIE